MGRARSVPCPIARALAATDAGAGARCEAARLPAPVLGRRAVRSDGIVLDRRRDDVMGETDESSEILRMVKENLAENKIVCDDISIPSYKNRQGLFMEYEVLAPSLYIDINYGLTYSNNPEVHVADVITDLIITDVQKNVERFRAAQT